MQKALFSRFPRLPSILTWVIYALGVVVRWFYITRWHDPRKFVYSDMAMYTGLAKRLAKPGYVVNIGDITHPPGFTWLLMFFQRFDATLQGAVYCNFVVCALLPLAVGALAWVTLGKRAAQGSVVVASLYYAFIDYGGFFLAEIHIALVATLTFVAYLLAMKLADQPPTRRRTAGFVGVAALAGFLFSLAMALKMVAMPAILGFCALHLLFSRTPKLRNRAIVLAVFLVAAAPVTAKLVHRCTVANEGHFCSGSNKSAADFLLGHYGRIEGIEWRDPATPGYVVAFGSPAAYQHGYRKKEVVPFLITNQKKNAEFAWKWIGAHPAEAFVLSIEHVWDCFGGSYPWPANSTAAWPGSYICHYLFLFFVFFPAMVLLVDVLRKRGLLGLLRSVELLIVSPIIGVCVAVFVASGETRYRIPWDGVFIVLAVELYRRMTFRFGEVKEEPAPLASAPPPVVEPAVEPAVAAGATERALSPGERVFTRDDPAKTLIVVARGTVRIERKDPVIRARFGPGSLVGGGASISFDTRPYTAEAESSAVVLELHREDVIDLLEDHVEMVHSIIAGLAEEREYVLLEQGRLTKAARG